MNGYAVSVEENYALESGTSRSTTRPKKPGFFKRWLLASVKDAIKEEQAQNKIHASDTLKSTRGLVVERGTGLDSQPMHLKIYRANGGTVVETTTYDRQKDRNQNQLHIIGHDTDLGEGFSKIITMESLRG